MKYSKANSTLKGGLGEKEVRLLLKAEADRLKTIIRKVWAKYEGSYSPKHYYGGTGARTGKTRNLLNALSVTPVFVADKATNTLGIRINFSNDLYHDSVLGGSQPKGHSFMLISTGWHSKKLEEKVGRVEHFTYRRGYNLIGKIIEEYNATKPAHQLVTIEFEWKGKK